MIRFNNLAEARKTIRFKYSAGGISKRCHRHINIKFAQARPFVAPVEGNLLCFCQVAGGAQRQRIAFPRFGQAFLRLNIVRQIFTKADGRCRERARRAQIILMCQS